MNKKREVYYFNHENRLIKEKNDIGILIRFIYNSKFGRLFRVLLNKRFPSLIYGIFQKTFLSRFKIKKFIKKYNIDASDFKKNVREFKSFNDFFIRELKKSARKIDAREKIIISPADSKLFVIPKIDNKVKFFIKNYEFDLKEFLGLELSNDFKNGAMMIFRLAPYDYHRFHFPFDSIASSPILINGLYESVNPIVYRSGVLPLTENERQVIILKNENNLDAFFVVVGAMFVGRIKFTYRPGKKYKKGDEVGYFEFGSSTIVLIFKKDVVMFQEKIIKNSSIGFETAVKVGQGVAEFLA